MIGSGDAPGVPIRDANAMFDFGKDLKRFVAHGVGGQGRDPRVLELLPTTTVAEQAAAEASAAGRASRPWRAWRDVALIWASHARRTGLNSSLEAAGRAASAALDAAPAGHAFAFASVTAAEVLLAKFDLRANEIALGEAEAAVEAAAEEPNSRRAQSAVAAVHARLRMRRALMEDDAGAVKAAAALLDAALHEDSRRATEPDPWRLARVVDLRLERAELTARAGLRWQDHRLLEQAGRDLRLLIETLDADLLPVSRARAVRMCGLSLSGLAAAAASPEAMEQAVELLASARDLFDVDHSPLDAASALSAQAETLIRWQSGAPVPQLLKAAEDMLARAWRLADGRSAALEVEIKVKAARVKTLMASQAGDMMTLSGQEARLRERLAKGDGRSDARAWAVDQLCLAGVYEALDDLGCQPTRGWAAAYARSEAMDVLREAGLAGGV